MLLLLFYVPNGTKNVRVEICYKSNKKLYKRNNKCSPMKMAFKVASSLLNVYIVAFFIRPCVAFCDFAWSFMVVLWSFYGRFMAFYFKTSSFLAVMDPNSFCLVCFKWPYWIFLIQPPFRKAFLRSHIFYFYWNCQSSFNFERSSSSYWIFNS